MQLVRTTLRIKPDLKKQAEKVAFNEERSLQDVFNAALDYYLKDKAQVKAKKIIFHTQDLGMSLDNLTRDEIYEEPKS